MKKTIFVFTTVLFFALALSSCNKDEVNNSENNNSNTENPGGDSGGGSGTAAGYVDLGLPSGTKWKSTNEIGNGTGLYDFDEAVSIFGSQLPTKEQLEELTFYCTWTWQNGSSYKVVGSNGNFIVLPADGARWNDHSTHLVGSLGCYWSSTPANSGGAWCLNFESGHVHMVGYLRSNGCSVRLVQN